jgi:SAM-dependent methyltransferase
MFGDAEAYERFMARWSRRLAEMFLDFTGFNDGDRLLDVGCGTGALAMAAASRTSRSEIVGVDPTETYVAFARARGATPRLHFDVGDARALTYADATFDRTLSLLVLQFIPDMDRALLEMCRVTRPGGIVGGCVWDAEAAGQGLVHLFWDAAVALDPSVEAKHVRNRDTSRRGGLAGKFSAHGLVEVTETTLTVTMGFTGFDDFWLPHLEPAGPTGAYVAGLSTEHRAALQARLRRAVLGDLPEGPFTLNTPARAVRGLVPPRVPSGVA